MGGGGEKTLSSDRIGNSRPEHSRCSRRPYSASGNRKQTSSGKKGTNRNVSAAILFPSQHWSSADAGLWCLRTEATSPQRAGVSN